MNVTSDSLAEQINQYITELNNLIEHLQPKDKRLPNIKLL